MAKETFHNLSSEKREKILDVLKTVFREKPFHEVTVKEIVEESGIARGSFYQYFDDLQEAYFVILNSELGDIHSLFIDVFRKQRGDIRAALIEYGKKLRKLLFEPKTYSIYKNYFIYWNENLDREWERWKSYKENHDKDSMNDIMNIHFDVEKINYIKGIIHNLIRRNYVENWSQTEFSRKYNSYVEWILGGIE
ncbi:TetR family transcriptional regulator [Clostridiales bacterium S5-A14a]|nr:TetR family transcriptional regulator [Clostridiales bacterium S5-A14a]